MNNFASFCFGSNMGVAIYSPTCELLTSGSMMMFPDPEWTKHLIMMRDKWQIDTVIVQAFGSIPVISKTHLEAVQTVYPHHILIHRDQWNPTLMSWELRRSIAEALLARKIARQEHYDAILCGKWVYDIIRAAGISFPAAFLEDLAHATKRFPRRADLRHIQSRILREAVNG